MDATLTAPASASTEDDLDLPDDWLLGRGQPWHHRVAPDAPAAPLGSPPPIGTPADLSRSDEPSRFGGGSLNGPRS